MHTNTMPILAGAAGIAIMLAGYGLELSQPHDLSYGSTIRVQRPMSQVAPCALDAIGRGQLHGDETHYWVIVKDDYGWITSRLDVRADKGSTIIEYRTDYPHGLGFIGRCI